MKKISFLFLAAGISGLFFVSCGFREPDPKQAVSDGMKKMFETETAKVNITISGKGFDTFPTYSPQDTTGKDKAEQPKEQPKTGSFTVQVHMQSDKKGGKSIGTLSLQVKDDKTNLEISLAFRVLEKTLYVQLSDFQFPETFGPQAGLASLKGKWWEIKNFSGNSTALKELNDEQKKTLEELNNVEFFTDISKAGEEDVEGAASRKYKAKLNSAALKQVILTLGKIAGNEIPETEAAAIEERLKNISFDGNVWVSKGNDAVDRIAGNVFSVDPVDSSKSTFDVQMTMSDFGKKFSVEKPADATPFDPSLLFGLAGGLPGAEGQTSLPPSDAPIDQPLGSGQLKSR